MPLPSSALARVAAVVVLASSSARPAAAQEQQLIAGQAVEQRLGAPLVGLRVRLLRLPDAAAAPVAVDSGQTHARGFFQLAAPGPGVYQLEFGYGRETLAVGPIDTVRAEPVAQRQYAVQLVQRAEERPFVEGQVETPVRQLPGVGGPEYPKELRDQRREGQVLTEFVVDADGRVVRGSMRVLRSTDAAFSASVRRAVYGLRFAPATIGGVPVRQLVQQPFDFRLGF